MFICSIYTYYIYVDVISTSAACMSDSIYPYTTADIFKDVKLPEASFVDATYFPGPVSMIQDTFAMGLLVASGPAVNGPVHGSLR